MGPTHFGNMADGRPTSVVMPGDLRSEDHDEVVDPVVLDAAAQPGELADQSITALG